MTDNINPNCSAGMDCEGCSNSIHCPQRDLKPLPSYQRCRICNAERRSDGCTHGLCGECHRACCTGGGDTYPGHGLTQAAINARRAQLRKTT